MYRNLHLSCFFHQQWDDEQCLPLTTCCSASKIEGGKLWLPKCSSSHQLCLHERVALQTLMPVTCALICEEIRVPVADLQFWSALVYIYQASPTKGHQALIPSSRRSSSDSLVRYMHRYLPKSHYLARAPYTNQHIPVLLDWCPTGARVCVCVCVF